MSVHIQKKGSSEPSAGRAAAVRLSSFALVLSVTLPSVLAGSASASPARRAWLSTYNSHGDGSDWGGAVVAANGLVFVTGDSTAGSQSAPDYETVAYRARDGAPVWKARYDGANGYDSADAITTNGTNVYVTGLSESASAGYDYLTIAYDAATGQRLWRQRYDGPAHGSDVPKGIATHGTRVYVTGYSLSNTSAHDYATLAYDAATGRRLWVRRYAPGQGASALTTAGGSVYVTGDERRLDGTLDCVTIAYDGATGRQEWVRRTTDSRDVDPQDHAVAPDSITTDGTRLYLAMTVGVNLTDWQTLALDLATGRPEWTRFYDDSRGYADTPAAVTTDGTRVYVTGVKAGSSNHDLWDWHTIAYDAASGDEVWSESRDVDDESDFARAITLANSRVYVAGNTFVAGVSTAMTVAYDGATGSQVWSDLYQAGGGSDGEISAASDRKHVYVAGTTLMSSFDYLTIAYEP